MRFQAAHKLITYLLVLAALGALGTTGAVSSTSTLVFLLAAAASFGVDPGRPAAAALDRSVLVARGVAGVLVAGIAWRIWRRMPDADLGPALDLPLVALGYKLLYRRSHRDYVQIYGLTFLIVAVASTIAATFLFLAIFAGYVVLATWGLILFHLRREMEENYLVRHSAQAPSQKVGIDRILGSRRVVGGAFFGATFGVAASVLVGALAIFALVPRPRAGFMLGARGAPGAIGLGDEVAIGRIGVSDGVRHEVVLRASAPDVAALPDDRARRAAAERLYFRGAVYDRYEQGRWIRSRRPELRTVLNRRGDVYFIDELGDDDAVARAGLTGTTAQEIEPVGAPGGLLTTVDRPIAVELPGTELGDVGDGLVVPRWSGEVGLGSGGDASEAPTLARARYVVYAAMGSRERGSRAVGLTAAARQDYLAWPAGLGRMGEIGARLGVGRDEAGKITAVVGWLRDNHAYTTATVARPAGADPVEDFLVRQPRGHCELFASAAVLLLRAAGVPARYVTGFRGGAWSSIGGYLAVRDERAHAWAEAFVPGAGWIRVDATPPGSPVERAGWLAETSDALDFQWSRWFVGYDLGRQRTLARRALAEILPPASAAWRRAGLVGGIVASLLGLGLGLALAARRVRQRRRGGGAGARAAARGWAPRGGDAIERLYRRAVVRLGRGGWPRRPSETPHEYARRLRHAGVLGTGAAAFDALTERYTAARFGGDVPASRDVARLGRAVAAASAALLGSRPGTRLGSRLGPRSRR